MQTEQPSRLETELVPMASKIPLAVNTAQLKKRAAGQLHRQRSSATAGLHIDTGLALYRIKGTTLVSVPLDNNIHFKRGTCFYFKPAFLF